MRPTSPTRGPADALQRGRLLSLGLLALLAFYLALTLLGRVDGGTFDPATMVYNSLLVLSAAICAARGLTTKAERTPWLLLGVALGLWAAGDLYYTFFLSGLDEVPYPSPADALYLSFYPVAYAALGILIRARVRHFHGSLWLDGIIGGLVVSAIGAAVVFDAVLTTTGGSKLVVATNLAYPLFDLLLLAMVVGVLALTGWRLDRTWVLTAGGFVAFGVADSAYLYQAAADTYVEGRLVDIGWVLGFVLLACAAWQPVRKIEEARSEGWQVLTLPTVFAFVGLALLVYDHFRPLSPLALALASASIAGVIIRAVVTFREKLRLLELSRNEALTDSLTGLGNRRRFMRDLEVALRASDESHPVVLVLLDLDGFKTYNDTFGHPAGDVLLSRLAANLELAVAERGRAYRMGGDEFCVIGTGSTAHAGPGALIDASAGALSEEGEGFLVTCSWGSVLLPQEADEISTALRLADGRMYAHKHRHLPSAGRQSMDVLLRALQERDSDPGTHLVDVAALAEAVGRRLRVPAEQLETLRQAAQLHDVGKIAIPDPILTKPGPLSDAESDFVRRHTVIGERILEAAPSLGPAARLVRSTHERFDGTGYPDGLAGRNIPLGARIIAVCNAFDAMTTERSHAPALTVDEALRELFRWAGTQFDPEVVEAFSALQSELRTELVA